VSDQLDLFAEPPGPKCPECGDKGFILVKQTCPCQDGADVTANKPGKAHTGGHSTEKAAAWKVEPRTGTQRARVMLALWRVYPDGLLHEEIGEIDGISDKAHRTRTGDLVKGGWVEDSGLKRLTDTNSESIVWRLTEKGAAWCRLNGKEAA
jgi:hypothetical protein